MPHASPNLKPTFLRWRIVAMLSGIVFLAHFNRVSISVAANAHFIGPEYPVFGTLMDAVGWQSAFAICGIVLMLFTLAWHRLSTDRPAQQLPGSEAPRSEMSLREVLGLLRNRSLLLLALSYGAIGYVQYLFFYWIEYYFKNVLKVSTSESRTSAFLITTGMAVGMIGGGWIADGLCRTFGRRWGCRAMAFLGMGLGSAFSLLGIATADANYVTLWFALALGSLGLCEGVFWTMAPILEPRRGGLACALVNTGGNGIGMLAPIITPILGLHFGWNSAIFVACLISAIGGILWLGIDETPRSRPEPRTASDHPIVE